MEVVLSSPIDSLGRVYRRDRLQEAYYILKEIPEEKIDLGEWCNPNHQCGTIACGLGWLAMTPHFQKLGLRITENVDGTLYPIAEIEDPVLGTVIEERYNAAAYLFMIDPKRAWPEEAQSLFSPCDEIPVGWDNEFMERGATTDKDILLSRLRYAIDFHSA